MRTDRKPGVRQTRPDYSNGLYGGKGIGLGPVARRGWDESTTRLIALAEQKGTAGLRHFYQTAPLRLLKVLIAIHPMAKMAHSNNAAAACSHGDVRVVVEQTVIDAETGEESQEVDAVETAEVNRWLDRYPGGQAGLMRALLKQLEWSGMYCLEAVPAAPGKGLARPITFDPLSVYYDDMEDGTRVVRQYAYGTPVRGGSPVPEMDILLDAVTSENESGTILINALDYEDDNPYGDPGFGGFLAEGIKDLGQERNLSDILRGWSYPHVSIGFPVDECIQRAKDNPQLLDQGPDQDPLTPQEYAENEFASFMDWLSTINPDDPLVMPKGSTAGVLDGGSGIGALEPILKMRRHRGVMGLDQMPNALGITDGGTQAYATEQARQQAKKLEYLRGLIITAILWLVNLHLRLQGKNKIARVETEPILPEDRLTDARARQIEVDTDLDLVDEGLLDREEAAMKHTGSGVVSDPRKADGERRGQQAKRSKAFEKTADDDLEDTEDRENEDK